MDMAQSANLQVQGAQGGHHRHHHMSIGDRISKMETAIDDAVKTGKLTDDQATTMKKALDDVKSTLSKVQDGSTGQTGAANQGSTLKQLSEDDRKKIRDTLQDVGKQLFAAINQGAASSAANIDNLFKALDTNGDGKVDKDELTAFLQKNGKKDQGPYRSYGEQGNVTMNLTITQSQFTVSA
jgi:hypothetical protein